MKSAKKILAAAAISATAVTLTPTAASADTTGKGWQDCDVYRFCLYRHIDYNRELSNPGGCDYIYRHGNDQLGCMTREGSSAFNNGRSGRSVQVYNRNWWGRKKAVYCVLMGAKVKLLLGSHNDNGEHLRWTWGNTGCYE